MLQHNNWHDETCTTVYGKVERLVRKCTPGISDDRVAEIMQLRAPPKPAKEELLNDQAADHLCDAFDATDLKSAKLTCADACKESAEAKALKNYLTRRGLVTQSRGSKSLDEDRPASSSSAAGGERSTSVGQRVKRPENIDLDTAKLFLPTGVKWVILQPYPQQRAFQIYYPRREPPYSRHITYVPEGQDGFSMHECLLGCLRWAWNAHTESSGEICPYTWLFPEAA